MKNNTIENAWSGNEKCKNCGIRNIVLFADLNHDDFEHIHHPIHEREFNHNALLYRLKDKPEHVYTIRDGLVKLVQYLPDGTPRIVRILKRGDLAGIEVTNGGNYLHDAIALTPVNTCQIPINVIDNLSRKTPRLHGQLLNRWKSSLITADTWMTGLNTGPARDRVMRLLLWLDENASDHFGNFYLPGREDIGAMLALTTETASRVIAELRRAHLVQLPKSQHAAIDRDVLLSMFDD